MERWPVAPSSHLLLDVEDVLQVPSLQVILVRRLVAGGFVGRFPPAHSLTYPGITKADHSHAPRPLFQAVFLASTILSLILVGRGQGKHIWEIPPEVIPTFALPGRVTSTLQVVALAWSKTSFAITLFNVVGQKTEKWILVFTIFSLNVLLAVSALLPWVACLPLE